MADLTFGQLILSKILPPDVYRPGQSIDKKSINTILEDVARKYPERYEDISFQLLQLGKDSGIAQGGASFDIDDLLTPPKAKIRRDKLKDKIKLVLETAPPEARNQLIVDMLQKARDTDVGEVHSEAEQLKNNLAMQLKGAGRGNPVNLARLIASDLIYSDSEGSPIPVPILRSYSQGLTPGEHLSSVFSSRGGLIVTKLGVGESGYLSKMLSAGAHRLAVTDVDAPEDRQWLASAKGLPVDTTDNDNVGSLLAYDAGPYKRNTVLTPKILEDLKDKGYDQIAVRSPLTTTEPEGGVYARDVGLDENHKLVAVGSIPGILAASALSEPLTQGALSCLSVGTLVRMADKSEKPIEEVDIGEWVLGADELGRVFPTLVTNIWDQGKQPVYKYTFSNLPNLAPVEVECTEEHVVLLSDGMNNSKEPIGRRCSNKTNDICAVYVSKTDKAYSDCCAPLSCEYVGERQCYDIEVSNPSSLFVLASGLVVSNSKHGGATAGGNISGFALIEKLVNTPKEFREAATYASKDGQVSAVKPAPQGGNYVIISGEKHYIPASANINVKLGQSVEAGDRLSSGPIHPHLAVKYKGLGEGARQVTSQIVESMRDSGLKVHRRNVELVVRGLLDRVRLTSEYGDYVPDDVVPYSRIESSYQPRHGFKRLPSAQAANKYLETPTLHYTIGTRITPSVIKNLNRFKIDKVDVHDEPPPFEPEVVRAVDLLQTDPDWLTRHYGTGLQKGLLKAVHEGDVSSTDSTSFVPARAKAVGFGDNEPFKLKPQV